MLLLKIKIFIQSLIFHINNGLPKSTIEEIRFRYNICTQCPHFDNNKSQCKLCGCNLSLKKRFMNKLAWADQKCPDNRWDQIYRK